jgi:tetratricopeptide (TPR) repeat protein
MKPTASTNDDGNSAIVPPVDQSLIERMRDAVDDMSANESTSAASLRAFVSCIATLARAAATEPHNDHPPSSAVGEAACPTIESSDESSCLDSLGHKEILRFKHFEIREMLGHGGFGVVFRAFDTLLGRDIALKLPRPEHLASPDTKRRLLNEAQTAALLDHPGIVPVYETGELGALWYIAAGLVDGPTLAAWQQGQHTAVAPRAAANIIATIADAVAHAHQRGVLHLDLKPSNVLLEPISIGEEAFPFHPRLTDFGLAGRLGREGATGRGTVAGTLRYMAPEQVRGDAQQIGVASDIYALGAMLYKLLTNRAPFEAGEQNEIARRIEQESPNLIREQRTDVPRDLDAICMKCLAKRPEDRYASTSALAEDLKKFLRGVPVAARPIGLGKRFARACQRRPVLAVISGVVALSALIGAAVVGYHRKQAELHAAVAREETVRADHQLEETQQWLLDASKVIQEAAPLLVTDGTALDDIASRINSHRTQLEKRDASPDMQLVVHTAGASLDALGAQHALPLQPARVVEDCTRHAVDHWLRVIRKWPERLAYRRALAQLLLGAAGYYEKANLPDQAQRYYAEVEKVLSPPWEGVHAMETELADMAKQLDNLAGAHAVVGRAKNEQCLRRCAVGNWAYLRTKTPKNLEFLTAWAIAQRQLASSISTRQQSNERDQIFATIETELDNTCDWDTAPASLRLVMADLLCRRASQASDREDHNVALDFLVKAQRHLQMAEQVQPRDAESRRVEIFMLRESATVHDALGQDRKAYDCLKRCRAIHHEAHAEPAENEPESLRYARLCRTIGTRAIQFDDQEEAVAAFSEASTIYSKQQRLSVQNLESHAQCVTALAKLYASAGNEELAESQFRLALDLWRRMQKRMPKSPVATAEVSSIERRLRALSDDAREEPVQ